MDDWFAAYAAELRAGDRAAIVARYHPDGAWIVRRGVPRLLTRPQLVERYRSEAWQPPVAFEWRNLVFEAVGAEGLLAIGQFVWGRPQGPRELVSYTGLLSRVEGAWRIRLEDENLAETL